MNWFHLNILSDTLEKQLVKLNIKNGPLQDSQRGLDVVVGNIPIQFDHGQMHTGCRIDSASQLKWPSKETMALHVQWCDIVPNMTFTLIKYLLCEVVHIIFCGESLL